MIKGILFDYDGTISHRYLAAFEMYNWFLDQVDSTLKEDPIKKELILQKCLLWDQYGTINKRFILEQLKSKYYPSLNVEEMYVLWYDHFHEFQHFMPGAKKALDELSKTYKLGMITNGPHKSQLIKIQKLGIEEYFHPLLISESFGVAKPDPSIYWAACQEMGLKPEEVIYVGDTFSTDIVGAIQAGLVPIWYCYEREGITNLAVKQVRDYSELVSYIKGLN